MSTERVSDLAQETLRRGASEDLPRVLEIETECFPHPWPRSAFELAIRTPRIHFLVAPVPAAERLAGYVVAVRDEEGVLVANLAVARARRRGGVGCALLRGAVGWARRIGAPRCHLEVRVGNAGAIALYRAEGFRPVGVVADYYRQPREDALSMELPLRRWHR